MRYEPEGWERVARGAGREVPVGDGGGGEHSGRSRGLGGGRGEASSGGGEGGGPDICTEGESLEEAGGGGGGDGGYEDEVPGHEGHDPEGEGEG